MQELVTINKQKVCIKEYRGKRVITFKDIDMVHERPEGTAKRNFNSNQKHFIKDEDYTEITREEFGTKFVPNEKIIGNPKITMMLLTESGYLMLVKSFTDDLSWSVQRQLVNSYFNPKQPQPLPTNLSPQLQLLINMELKQKEQDQKILELEDKTDKQSEAIRTIKETLLSKMEGEGYNKWVIQSIKSIAQSEYFIEHTYRYQEVWSESYKRLTEKAGCNLNTLVNNAKKRAAESGATKAQISKICKLSVIEMDKKLRELYSAVLKEMLAIYCMEVA